MESQQNLHEISNGIFQEIRTVVSPEILVVS
jgi:hypothetical protein